MKLNKEFEETMSMPDRIAWTEQLLNQIKEGGIWLVPRSSCAYIIYHSEKSVERIGCGDGPVEEVLQQMGWKII